MNAKSKIKLNQILKRSSCLNSIIESNSMHSENVERLYDNIMNKIESGNGKDANIKRQLRSYIENLCNTESASQYYYQPISLIEEFNKIDSAISDRILYEYTTRVIPYIKELNDILPYLNRHDSLKDYQIDSISEAVSNNIAAERIIRNHGMISKRFNIEREVHRYRSLGLKYIVDSCADMIDTYDIKSYQKLSITIEETMFILDKNNYEYNTSDLVRYTLDHFLMQEGSNLTNKDIENYKRAIRESYLLDESDLDTIRNFVYSDTQIEDYSSIKKGIDSFLLSTDKSVDKLKYTVDTILHTTTKEDILANINNLMYLIWDACKCAENNEQMEAYASIIGNISVYFTKMTKFIDNMTSIDQYTKEELGSIIEKLCGVRGEIESYSNSNIDLSLPAVTYLNILNQAISGLMHVHGFLYDNENIENIEFVNGEIEESLVLSEFKIFKFNNLVKAAFNLNKYLKAKERQLYLKGKNKIQKFVSKATNILFGETASSIRENIYDYIGSDSKADICVMQYEYAEEDLQDISEFLSSVCNEFNNILLADNFNTARAYYILNPGVAEVHIKDKTGIQMTEEEVELVEHSVDPADYLYLSMIESMDNLYEQFKGFDTESIEDQLTNISNYNNFTIEHYSLALEALQYLSIDKDIIKVFAEKFNDYQFNKADIINESSFITLARQEKKVLESAENWEPLKDVPIEITLEAYDILESILNEAGPQIHKPAVGPNKATGGSWADDWDDDEDDDVDEEEDSKAKTTGADTNKEEDKKPEESDKKEDDETIDLSDVEASRPKHKRGMLNLNSIKLGLKGLATKIKDKGTKYKEMSRNLDSAVRAYVKAYKETIQNDRREAIIKGRLIPSFSRCIRAGIGLAILGIATGGVVIPLIAGIAGLALNKKATDRERYLLLDEIETELEVVEKEMQYAEENREMKKYRALLAYKKELQRQYQRIRYNIKLTNSKYTPSSKAGMQGKDEE